MVKSTLKIAVKSALKIAVKSALKIVNAVAEFFARLEVGHMLAAQFNRSAGLWITA